MADRLAHEPPGYARASQEVVASLESGWPRYTRQASQKPDPGLEIGWVGGSRPELVQASLRFVRLLPNRPASLELGRLLRNHQASLEVGWPLHGHVQASQKLDSSLESGWPRNTRQASQKLDPSLEIGWVGGSHPELVQASLRLVRPLPNRPASLELGRLLRDHQASRDPV